MKIFSDAQGQLSPQSVFGFGQNLNSVETLWLSRFNTCQNEDPIKNEGTRVATRLYVDFLDIQGQITP